MTNIAVMPSSEDLEQPDTGAFCLLDGSQNGNPKGISFWTLVAEDFRTHRHDILSQGFWALFWHRLGNWRMSIPTKFLRLPLKALYFIGYKSCQWFGGIELSYNTKVGRRVRIEHFGSMVLIAREIGDDVTIRHNTTFGISGLNRMGAYPVIGNGVEIGVGSVILGGINIGDNAIIGANSVVVRPVPPNAIVAGTPARLIRMRETVATAQQD